MSSGHDAAATPIKLVIKINPKLEFLVQPRFNNLYFIFYTVHCTNLLRTNGSQQ